MNTNENVLRIVSAVADRNKVVLYKEDGDTVIIHQGDHRLRALVNEIIPITARGEVAVVSLEKFSVYADFEKNTGGLIKMFRVARKKLKSWLGVESTTEVVILDGESSQEAAPVTEPVLEALQESLEPVGLSEEVAESETIVAVVNKKVIPDVHKMKHLMQNANKNASTKAIENLLKRLAAIIDKRRHSVEDLMRFLEKADLPIADDGSIIAYKMLKRKDDYYVDCHTRRVKQRVGSYVHVKESLVDLNRRNECSEGLHIARRKYLGSFNGDVCVLCKIAPEDVMVVPHDDANKIRVKGYHILAELSPEALIYLKNDKPMTSDVEALRIVYTAIKGHHIDVLETVEVTGRLGTGVVITPVNKNKNKSKTKTFEEADSDIKIAAAIDDTVTSKAVIEPKEINKRLAEMEAEEISQEDLEAAAEKLDELKAEAQAETKTEAKTPKEKESLPKPLTKAQQARELYKDWETSKTENALDELVLFKKKTKKGWAALGFSDKEIKLIEKAFK